MKSVDSVFSRGILAGFVGGSVLALWFLIIDGVSGRPFHTPAFLAAIVTGRETVTFTPALIALYTAFHYAAFLVVGVAAAWVMEKLQTVPGVLLGIILGFLLFDLVFYGAVWVTGIDVVGALGWPEVLAGNVLAGMMLTGALNLLGPQRSVSWRVVLEEHRILREGIVAGLIGAVAVAVWFLVLDLFMGRLFFTPGALGSVLFHGARSAAEVQMDALTIIGYTLLHLTAFLVVGLIAAALATEAEEYAAPVILGAIMLFVTFETFFIGMLAIVAQWLLAVLPWWSIAVGNLVAAASMGWYLWHEHPALRKAWMDHELEEETV
ncbi:MAG TPA: hypothetical protein VMK65_12675 [Longimicrobiales bacterium]|nr:hypothetical protein [Longimicrobiales bacterium]